MAKIEITINGVAYPCRPTMGAMLRFKRETGKEVTEIDATSLSDLCAYLYCCVASAASADGIAFDLSFMDFADKLNPEEMNAWVAAISGDAVGEKKRPKRRA